MTTTRGRPSIAIAVLDGTVGLDLAVALQAFGPRPTAFLAMRDELESPYDVYLCGGPDTRLRTLGMGVRDLHPWDRLTEADTVVVPGLDEPDRRRDPEALAAIAVADARGARLVALCTGVFVLGFAGVLDGHRVTTHWALADAFRRLFPQVDLHDDELFVDDGNVLTSGGMLAAADLCLHVLRQDHGQAYANDVARLLVSPPFRVGGQAQYRVNGHRERAGSLTHLMSWIDAHLHERLTLAVLADRAGTSTRTLSRRFDVETGRGALQWIAERRIAKARAMLEDTDRSITDIAFSTGFGSLGAFRRQFARATGTTPRAYRSTFQQA
ncbi:MAG: helix-turn-helix domain-containing protein [Actinobacteria bacterium]|nr:helix-turn-helix domain-containing protein [Actinomycetota bacterium]